MPIMSIPSCAIASMGDQMSMPTVDRGEIVIYQETLEVRLEQESVWLNLNLYRRLVRARQVGYLKGTAQRLRDGGTRPNGNCCIFCNNCHRSEPRGERLPMRRFRYA